ncbi:DUF1287 domain-containing protein [Pseudobacteroides cellulosolvens]|uniref:DUF1287 domain-containing protein n=1 Tax=Pseudobacteroides cellulosolvens ATCC 35603 = DSM 2933 TaxID=398512 RepID=A0A0L6JUU4_9FIRM|nr:DUF1287 domain-containing protein [Pseudobacteroides cellulosolvens]KNY29598.1 protein of unknown function DUF1287 [Pseudobacteroides cellulosolvens ATCC 35603 = DSM 2933]
MRIATLFVLSIISFSFVVQGCNQYNSFSPEISPIKSGQIVSESEVTPRPSVTNLPYSSTPTPLNIPKVECSNDKDDDGINDLADIVEGAKKDAENKPVYRSEYYSGGYPPDSEGVCTDVIWRAFRNAGYELKDMVDKDIKSNKKQYPAVEGKPDPNIDFRRVRNLKVFFSKYAKKLTTEIKPNDIQSLQEWQGGDIVTFSSPEHIAIVSDKRNSHGIPYLIHNAGPYTMEVDNLMTWISGISGHFRFPNVR